MLRRAFLALNGELSTCTLTPSAAAEICWLQPRHGCGPVLAPVRTDSPVADVGWVSALSNHGWAGVQRVVHKVAAVLADPAQAQRREQLRQPAHIIIITIIINIL